MQDLAIVYGGIRTNPVNDGTPDVSGMPFTQRVSGLWIFDDD